MRCCKEGVAVVWKRVQHARPGARHLRRLRRRNRTSTIDKYHHHHPFPGIHANIGLPAPSTTRGQLDTPAGRVAARRGSNGDPARPPHVEFRRRGRLAGLARRRLLMGRCSGGGAGRGDGRDRFGAVGCGPRHVPAPHLHAHDRVSDCCCSCL